jgi:hypothetical protein
MPGRRFRIFSRAFKNLLGHHDPTNSTVADELPLRPQLLYMCCGYDDRAVPTHSCRGGDCRRRPRGRDGGPGAAAESSSARLWPRRQ